MAKFTNRSGYLKNITLIGVLLLVCLSTVSDARRSAGVKRGGGSKSSGSSRKTSSSSSSSSNVQQQHAQPAYANPASLSYGPGQQVAQKPSAPVDTGASRPIGWNTGHESPAAAVNKPPVNSAPYPTHNNGFPQAPPPNYQQNPNPYGHVNGPPPPYQAVNQPGGVQSRFNEPPPQYSQQGVPHNPGYPVQQGFPQQAGAQPGFPGGAQQYPGGFPGGNAPYPQQPGLGQPGFAQPGIPQGQPTIVNNYHGVPQQGGGGGSGLGGNLQTGLLLGVGGLGLYNALKPSDTKTVIINNTVIQEVPVNATEAVNGTHVETTPVPLASYPASPASAEMIPLAPYPSTGMYPALPSSATMTQCNGTECTSTVMESSVHPTEVTPAMNGVTASDASMTQVTNSNQSPSSLAPLTTFAAMAHNEHVASALPTLPPLAPMPDASAPPTMQSSPAPTQTAQMSTTSGVQQASALNAGQMKENQTESSQRDSGSAAIKASLALVMPLLWIVFSY